MISEHENELILGSVFFFMLLLKAILPTELGEKLPQLIVDVLQTFQRVLKVSMPTVVI